MMKRGMIMGALIGVLVFTAAIFAEDITLTTYYPAPYGEYEQLYVSGNLGIGTTAPIAKLDIASGDDSNGLNGSDIALGYYDGSGYRHWIRTRHNAPTDVGNTIEFYTNTGNTGGDSSTPGTGNVLGLVIDNGNVGIGTTAPIGALLNIAGSFQNPLSDAGMTYIDSTTAYAQDQGGSLLLRGTHTTASSAITAFAGIKGAKENATSANTAGYLALYTKATGANLAEQMRITSSGNVGIGTAGPRSKLDVADNTNMPYITLGRAGFTLASIGVEDVGDWNGAIVFKTDSDGVSNNNPTEKVRIDKNGKVGIGTTVPSVSLHVYKSGGVYSTVETDGANQAMIHTKTATGNSVIAFQTNADNRAIIGVKGSDNKLYLNTGNTFGTTQGMIVDTSGSVGIGTTGPTHLIHLNGGAYCDGTGDWAPGSDIAYKKDVDYAFKYGLKEVRGLKPVYYVHKEDKNNKKQIGFIAQDVLEIIPEVVSGSEGTYGLSYGRLTAILVKAMQEQQEEIEELRKEQQAENEALKARISALEAELR